LLNKFISIIFVGLIVRSVIKFVIMESIFLGFQDKASKDNFIEFIKNRTIYELEKGIINLEVAEAALISYEKDELFYVCEGIKLAIQEYKSKL